MSYPQGIGMLEFLKENNMAITKETKAQYITASRSLHELENTIAYYNYEGAHYRVFNSYEDAVEFAVVGSKEVTVVADFNTEEELNSFLENCEICTVCGTVCFPDDECYTDYETGDSCCTNCCFYDESNDMYHKGTIEEAYYTALVKLESPLYIIQQHDKWFNDMLAEFGTFRNKEDAIQAMMDGFEKLYPGFKEDVYFDNKNQWTTDKYEFGVTIAELSANNTFGEM